LKKIILIWDLYGAIGQINSTFPYNFNFKQLPRELDNVRYALDVLDDFKVKTTFAVTGFSAEEGVYPYVFPELINEIHKRGHEIASHSWRHEWIPIFTRKQISKSLLRSREILEKAISGSQPVVGFVPPHNRPMSWISRGAFSLGDRGIFPFFKMGDTQSLISLLNESGYKWMRISHHPILSKLGLIKNHMAGRLISENGILILENHYLGFDSTILNHVLQSDEETFTISAHPLMLDYDNKSENKENFEAFLKGIQESNQLIKFVSPSDLLNSLSFGK
jgi:hypothetical protein